MSVCDWGAGDGDGFVYQCPCLSLEFLECSLGEFEEEDPLGIDRDSEWGPSTCRHVEALKAVLEDPEMHLIAVR